MNEYALYEGAMQVVPLLLIALFLDRRSTADQTGTGWLAKLWLRLQNRIIAVLGIVAYFVSMFVVAGVLERTTFTASVVISALSGSVGLLFSLIWRRFDTPVRTPQRPSEGEGEGEVTDPGAMVGGAEYGDGHDVSQEDRL